jgi:hypothetical protein
MRDFIHAEHLMRFEDERPPLRIALQLLGHLLDDRQGPVDVAVVGNRDAKIHSRP